MAEAKSYDKSYKEQAIKLAKEIGNKKASNELGLPYSTLYGWIKAGNNGDLDIGERTPENAMSLLKRYGSCAKKQRNRQKKLSG